MANWLEWVCGFILFIIVVSCLSSTAKFYVRVGCYYLTLVIAPAVSLPPAFLTPFTPNNTLLCSWVFRNFLQWVYGIEWVLKNPKNIPQGSCIFVVNHQSSLDVQGMMSLYPKLHPYVSVMKRELFWTGPFGILCWLSDAVFINRCDTAASRDILNRKVKEIAKKGYRMWIFPEGTRNNNGSILPFKKGAFHMAVNAQIPIVPVVFSNYESFYSITEKKFDGGEVTVTILPPISTVGLTSEHVNKLAEDCHRVMLDCFNRGNGPSKAVPIAKAYPQKGSTQLG